MQIQPLLLSRFVVYLAGLMLILRVFPELEPDFSILN